MLASWTLTARERKVEREDTPALAPPHAPAQPTWLRGARAGGAPLAWARRRERRVSGCSGGAGSGVAAAEARWAAQRPGAISAPGLDRDTTFAPVRSRRASRICDYVTAVLRIQGGGPVAARPTREHARDNHYPAAALTIDANIGQFLQNLAPYHG